MAVTTTLLPAHTTARKIYIQRDYTQGLAVRFNPSFPAELSGRIDSNAFDFVIGKVNRIFAKAERVSIFSVLDSLVGCLTAYLIYACYDSYYDRCLHKITRLIDDQNETVWKPKGLLLTDPKDRGLRVIEITVFDAAVHANGTPAAAYQETALE